MTTKFYWMACVRAASTCNIQTMTKWWVVEMSAFESDYQFPNSIKSKPHIWKQLSWFSIIVCECDILKEYEDTVSVNGSKFLEREKKTIVFIDNIKEDNWLLVHIKHCLSDLWVILLPWVECTYNWPSPRGGNSRQIVQGLKGEFERLFYPGGGINEGG